MDFNEVVEGDTVYLPVQQPGALLYLGDAHALQRDGETTQYVLETSMEVTVTVDLIKNRAVSMPRVESPTQIMVLGQAGSLALFARRDDARVVEDRAAGFRLCARPPSETHVAERARAHHRLGDGQHRRYRSVLAHRLDSRQTVVTLNNTSLSRRVLDQFAKSLFGSIS